jgi:hypothetical protein
MNTDELKSSTVTTLNELNNLIGMLRVSGVKVNVWLKSIGPENQWPPVIHPHLFGLDFDGVLPVEPDSVE